MLPLTPLIFYIIIQNLNLCIFKFLKLLLKVSKNKKKKNNFYLLLIFLDFIIFVYILLLKYILKKLCKRILLC